MRQPNRRSLSRGKRMGRSYGACARVDRGGLQMSGSYGAEDGESESRRVGRSREDKEHSPRRTKCLSPVFALDPAHRHI